MTDKKSTIDKQRIIFLNEYFNLILLIAFIVISFFAFLVLIFPKYKITVQLIKDNITVQQQLYILQAEKLADLKTIVKIYDEISPANLSKFDNVLPDNYIITTLFGELEEVIVSQGYTLNSIKLSEAEPSFNKVSLLPDSDVGSWFADVGAVQVDLNISGVGYNNLKQLLKIFETSARLFDVKNLEFSSGGSVLNLTLITYYKS